MSESDKKKGSIGKINLACNWTVTSLDMTFFHKTVISMRTFWMVGISLQYAVVDSSIHVISNLIRVETWKGSIVSFAMIDRKPIIIL